MGSSYTKQDRTQIPEEWSECMGRLLPLDDFYGDPWRFAENLYEQLVQLQCQTLDLQRELIDLKGSHHYKHQPPKRQPEPEKLMPAIKHWFQKPWRLKHSKSARSGASLSEGEPTTPKCTSRNT